MNIPVPPDQLARIVTLRDRTCLGHFTTLSDTGILTAARDYMLLSNGEQVMWLAVECIADYALCDIDWQTSQNWLSADDYDVLRKVTGMAQHRAPGAAGLMREVLR